MLITSKEFKEFLLYIGITTDDTESNFKDILDLIQSSCSNNNSNHSRLCIDELLSSSLECYLQQMTSVQRREMAVNIVNRFKENKLSSGYSKMVKLVVLYSKLQIMPLYTKFIKWRHIRRTQAEYQLSTQNQDAVYDDLQKSNVDQTPHDAFVTGNKLHHLSRSMRNFMERQEKFKKTQSKSIAKVMSNNELEHTLICTFSPQINHQSTPCLNNYINKVNAKDPCLRLYEESKIRLSKKEQFVKEKNDGSNSKHSRSTKTPIKNRPNPYVKQYEDFKQQKESKKRLKERLDNESDCTFKPVSYHNPHQNPPYNKPTSRPSSNISRSGSQILIENIMTKAGSYNVLPLNRNDNLPQRAKGSLLDN